MCPLVAVVWLSTLDFLIQEENKTRLAIIRKELGRGPCLLGCCRFWLQLSQQVSLSGSDGGQIMAHPGSLGRKVVSQINFRKVLLQAYVSIPFAMLKDSFPPLPLKLNCICIKGIVLVI